MEFDDPGAHGLAHPRSDCTVECGVRGVLPLPPRLIDEGAKAPADPPGTQATCGVERVREVRTLRTTDGTGDALNESPGHTTGTSCASCEPCNVYLMWAEDELLYVGISSAFGYRLKQHRKEKAWWPEVTRVEVEHHATRDDALDRERYLIAVLQPPHNIQGKGVGAGWADFLCPECTDPFDQDAIDYEIEWRFGWAALFEDDGWICNGFWFCENCQDEAHPGPSVKAPEEARIAPAFKGWERYREFIMDCVLRAGMRSPEIEDRVGIARAWEGS